MAVDPVSIVLLSLGLANAATGVGYELGLGIPMKRMVAKLNKAMADDQNLKERIINAYNTKNPSLMSNVLSTVPGGLANDVAKMTKKIKDSVHNRNMNELDKNIANNAKNADMINAHMPDMINMMSNAGKADWWERQGGKHIKPSKANLGSKKDTFEYKDVYGNKKTGNVEALNKWTYGEKLQPGISTVRNDKPGIITTYKK